MGACQSYCQALQTHERCCAVAEKAPTSLSILACQRCHHRHPSKPAATRSERCNQLTSWHPQELHPPSGAATTLFRHNDQRQCERSHDACILFAFAFPALLSTALFPPQSFFDGDTESQHTHLLLLSSAALDQIFTFRCIWVSGDTARQHTLSPLLSQRCFRPHCFYCIAFSSGDTARHHTHLLLLSSAAFHRTVFSSQLHFGKHSTTCTNAQIPHFAFCFSHAAFCCTVIILLLGCTLERAWPVFVFRSISSNELMHMYTLVVHLIFIVALQCASTITLRPM